MNNGWWTIPSEKAKNNLSHRVPLSSLALQLLEQVKLLSGNSRWLFPSRQGDKPLLDTSIDHVLHKNEAKFAILPFTTHDLRRTAASLDLFEAFWGWFIDYFAAKNIGCPFFEGSAWDNTLFFGHLRFGFSDPLL